MFDKIGHAFVLFGNREQLRSDLGKSGSCGLIPKGRRVSLVAMRVRESVSRYPLPGNQRPSPIVLGGQSMPFPGCLAFFPILRLLGA